MLKLKIKEGVKADIIVLPELAFTGYFFQDRSELASLAEDPANSATVSSLIALCRDCDLFLVTGFAEKIKSAEVEFIALILDGTDHKRDETIQFIEGENPDEDFKAVLEELGFEFDSDLKSHLAPIDSLPSQFSSEQLPQYRPEF